MMKLCELLVRFVLPGVDGGKTFRIISIPGEKGESQAQ
jgi:hypothetical protein